MPTKVKVKIEDNGKLRIKIDELYEKTNQVNLAKWSLLMAKHVLDIVGIDYYKKRALRVVGQAVGSGHMKEHAMVASDYSIKIINMISLNDFDSITKEREWQLRELKKFH